MNGVIIDCVLTEKGRELLARNNGQFEIVKYAFGDDEIDYSLFNPSTGSLQQDQNLLNTPVFEAFVNEKVALKSRLLTISNPDLKYLPKLEPKVAAISLGERTDSQVGKTVEFSQKTNDKRVVPSEIVDPAFIIYVNNDLLFVEKQTPVSITNYGTSQYILPRTSINSAQGAEISLSVAVQSIPSEVWAAVGSGVAGSRTIPTVVRCEGVLSGLSSEVNVTISEEFTR